MSMPNTNIILLSGSCYCGKSFIKKALLTLKSNDFRWFGGAFAHQLKNEMHDLALIDKKQLDNPTYKTTVRASMQDYGQKRRAWSPDYWAAKLHEAIGDDFESGATYIVDDWRFINEAEYFKREGFNVVTVRVFRPVELMRESVGNAVVQDYLEHHSGDVSETELQHKYATDLSYFDYVIFNNQMGSGHLIKKFAEIEHELVSLAKFKQA
jgi:phosphomevalonate kinase